MEDIIYIKDLRIKTIIGIFDWERKVKQEVSIDMEFPFDCKKAARTDSIEDTTDYKAITKAVITELNGVVTWVLAPSRTMAPLIASISEALPSM